MRLLLNTVSGALVFGLIFSSFAPAAHSTITLQGRIEAQDAPQVEQFSNMIAEDHRLPCWVKSSMPRLIRVAHDSKMRVLVWKRMCREELMRADSKMLAHIESLAQSCNMPLVRVRGCTL